MSVALPIDAIAIRSDARAIDPSTVSGIADSIAKVGLINPVRVRAVGDRWELIAGVHRYNACRSLGLTEIEAIVCTDDDLHAELAMIDENLCRAELSASDRAKQTARRKAIYLKLHPETAHGGDRKSDQVANSATRSFADETAAATGASTRTVRLDAERGEKIFEGVFDLIAGTVLENNGAFLDRIKNLSPSDQMTSARNELAFRASQEREKNRSAKQAKIQADVKSRAATEVAELLAEHVPGDWWDALKANLYAAGAKNVADAFTNITGQSIMDRRYGT